MNSVTKVIIGFVSVTVIGSGVIGYGIYQKYKRRDEQGKVLSQARGICSTNARSFALMGPAQRLEMLDRAAKTKLELADLEDIDTGELAALTSWIEDATRLHEALEAHSRQVGDVLATLRHEYPVDTREQLATDRQQALEKAAAAAGRLVGLSVQLDKGEVVKMAELLPEEVQELRRLAQAARGQIAAREAGYKDAVSRLKQWHQTQAANAGLDDIQEKVDEARKWLAYARACPEKTAELTKLLGALDAARGSASSRTQVETKLKDILATLDNSSAGYDRGVILQRAEQVVREAKALNDPQLVPAISRVELRLAALRTGTDKDRKRDKLIAQLVELFPKLAATTSTYSKSSLTQEITRVIGQLRPVAPGHAAFFQSAMQWRKQAEEQQANAQESSQTQQTVGKVLDALRQLQSLSGTSTAVTTRRNKLILDARREISTLQRADAALAAFFTQVLNERAAGQSKTSSTPPPSSVDVAALSSALINLQSSQRDLTSVASGLQSAARTGRTTTTLRSALSQASLRVTAEAEQLSRIITAIQKALRKRTRTRTRTPGGLFQ